MLNSITRNLFISYAREDKPIAETLHAYLKPLIAQGRLRVFIDTEEIEKGEEWHQKITSQLHQADAFLFLVSQHYFRSNYVVESELPAMIKRYREEQVECWPFLVSDYPWDDFVIDGFNLASIQAIGPFDANKRLIPLKALPMPDQDSQYRSVYTEVRDWIDKFEQKERQKQEALARRREQKEQEEKQRLAQEEEQRKHREHQERERKQQAQEKHSSAVQSEMRRTDARISEPSTAESGSPAKTSTFPYKYLWLLLIGLLTVVYIFKFEENRKQKHQEEMAMEIERARRDAEYKAREEAEESHLKVGRVAELLDQAVRQIDADRLTYPPGDNALESIRQAQEIEPDNTRGRELLQVILDRYLQLTQRAIVKKEFDKGQQYLDRARLVDAGSSRLAEAQDELDAARRQKVSSLSQPESGGFRDALASGGEGPEMVKIPAGSFIMGSAESEPDRGSDEGPQREVQIRSFSLGKTEVTFDDYDRFAEATGRQRPEDEEWGRGSRPVINVSWEDAVAYAEWLSKETGERYRLPSEAEWEYAARAGTTKVYPWGEPSRDHSNYGNVFGFGGMEEGADKWIYTAPVGQFMPNDWQLHDMLGNVSEWVQDCYVHSYIGARKDGTPREVSGICKNRVLRGGSWSARPQDVRSANRYGRAPDLRNFNIGFRLARS